MPCSEVVALAVAVGALVAVAAAAAVAGRDVEEAVRAKREPAAVVVGRRVVENEDPRRRRVGDVGVADRTRVALDHDVAVLGGGAVARVEDVEMAGRGVVRVGHHRQQAALAAVEQRAVEPARREVEERGREHVASDRVPDEDRPLLGRDQATAALVAWVDEDDRVVGRRRELGRGDQGRDREARRRHAGPTPVRVADRAPALGGSQGDDGADQRRKDTLPHGFSLLRPAYRLWFRDTGEGVHTPRLRARLSAAPGFGANIPGV